MELIIKPYRMPESIEFNFDELKNALSEKVREYETAIYSDDQIKTAKADKAALNKLKKAINDERIRREKEYMVPFTEFKSRVNEIIAIIDKPITAIDEQLKAYEAKTKEEKRQEIVKILLSYELPYEISLERVWNERWLNATYDMKDIKAEISEKAASVIEDVNTLETLTEYRSEAIAEYKTSLDLRSAMAEVNRQRQRAEELKKIEERLKAAEAEKKAEIKPEPVKADTLPKEETETVKPAENPAQWLSFKAFMNIEQAKALRAFCIEQGIKLEAI